MATMDATTTLLAGARWVDRKSGEQVRIARVTSEFVEWRDEQTGSHGKMLRCYFGNFFREAETVGQELKTGGTN